ncbi:hypothetical protein KSP39_PZI022372 [Platanthera zijinensis]|uniref:Uncharacterized protein n=1 Tax=Platanthera zijinensis TaxID=2320716 RepID=A0AAP0FUP4_9ASPA
MIVASSRVHWQTIDCIFRIPYKSSSVPSEDEDPAADDDIERNMCDAAGAEHMSTVRDSIAEEIYSVRRTPKQSAAFQNCSSKSYFKTALSGQQLFNPPELSQTDPKSLRLEGTCSSCGMPQGGQDKLLGDGGGRRRRSSSEHARRACMLERVVWARALVYERLRVVYVEYFERSLPNILKITNRYARFLLLPDFPILPSSASPICDFASASPIARLSPIDHS